MKKIGLILLAVLICVSGLKAQNDESGTKPMWGIKFGVDMNIPSKWRNAAGSFKMFNQGVGVNLGAVCNFSIGQSLYIEPGASLFYDNYSFDDLNMTDVNGNVVDTNAKAYKIGLRIPVVVGYVFDFTDNISMCVYTGPEFNYAFAGKYSTKIEIPNKDDFPTDPFTEQRRVDLAWKLGLGFPVSDFLISLDASLGITDLLKSPDISFRENRLTLAATYYF